jgi:pentose-5-phosphate-3-epimerase
VVGVADFSVLDKVKELKSLKPDLEIGWDGGVSDQNVGMLAASGVDVLNTGGFIQNAANPQAAYQSLEKQINSLPDALKSL